jgi:hypothetical protein
MGCGTFVQKYNDHIMGHILWSQFKKTFPSEHERYVFLRKVYDALLEWANVWEGFKYDSESTLKLDGDVWTISCARRYKDKRDRKHYHTTRELMKKNIFF